MPARHIRPTLVAAGALLSVVALAGCGGSDSSGATAGPASPTSSSTSGGSTGPSTTAATITIKDFAFAGPSTVKPGQTVTVTNEDSEAHTLTADSAGSFDVNVQPGASATFTAPAKPGRYPYHCNFHSNMHGTLTVR